MGDVLAVYNDGNWASEVLQSDTPVLVDFWAEWCAPCKAMVPALEAVAAQFNGKLKVGKLNVEENNTVPDQYAITSRHKAPVELLVLESSPVAVNDKITVESAFEPKPKTLDWEEKRGVTAWEQPLAPGQTLKFVADYTISYPKDVAIAGLP